MSSFDLFRLCFIEKLSLPLSITRKSAQRLEQNCVHVEIYENCGTVTYRRGKVLFAQEHFMFNEAYQNLDCCKSNRQCSRT